MKTNIRLVIGATIAALGGAITLISEAKVGGVYWSNRGSGDVVVKRCRWYQWCLCAWLLWSQRMCPLLTYYWIDQFNASHPVARRGLRVAQQAPGCRWLDEPLGWGRSLVLR